MFTNTEELDNGKPTVLIYGASGSGKTHLAGTLPKALFINADQGLLTLRGKKIPVYDLTKMKDKEGNIIDVPRNKRFERMVNFIQNELPKYTKDFEWVVFDSLNQIAEDFAEHLEGVYPDKKDTLNLWMDFKKTISRMLKSMRDNADFGICFLSLDKMDEDETKKKIISVGIPTNLSRSIPGLFDYVFYLKMEEKDGVETRKVITRNYRTIIAKDRSTKLDLFEEPDMVKIFKKANAK